MKQITEVLLIIPCYFLKVFCALFFLFNYQWTYHIFISSLSLQSIVRLLSDVQNVTHTHTQKLSLKNGVMRATLSKTMKAVFSEACIACQCSVIGATI